MTSQAPADAPEQPTPLADGGTVDAWLEYHNEQMLQMLLDMHPDAEVAEVTMVRMIDLAEWPDTMASCLTEAGFAVTVSPDGGVGPNGGLPEGQAEAYAVAMYVCQVQYPTDPTYSQPLNDDQLELIYRYYVDELTPCLQERGYVITPPPSLEVFLQSWGGPNMWAPYNDVPPGDMDSWYELNEQCPQNPSNDVLYGEP